MRNYIGEGWYASGDPCRVKDCKKFVYARSVCKKHHRLWQLGDTTIPVTGLT